MHKKGSFKIKETIKAKFLIFIICFALVLVSFSIVSSNEDPNTGLLEVIGSYGYDDDSDGLFDYLNIELDVTVNEEGFYSITANLWYYGREGSIENFDCITAEYFLLDIGTTKVTIHLPGWAINNSGLEGIFNYSATLVNQSQIELYTIENTLSESYNYLDFDSLPAEFNDSFSEGVIDDNLDGTYEFFKIDGDILVNHAGYYNLKGTLYYQNGGWNELCDSDDFIFFSKGTQTFTLAFNGFDIGALPDNMYDFKVDLTLLAYGDILPISYGSYTSTQSYNSEDFVSDTTNPTITDLTYPDSFGSKNPGDISFIVTEENVYTIKTALIDTNDITLNDNMVVWRYLNKNGTNGLIELEDYNGGYIEIIQNSFNLPTTAIMFLDTSKTNKIYSFCYFRENAASKWTMALLEFDRNTAKFTNLYFLIENTYNEFELLDITSLIQSGESQIIPISLQSNKYNYYLIDPTAKYTLYSPPENSNNPHINWQPLASGEYYCEINVKDKASNPDTEIFPLIVNQSMYQISGEVFYSGVEEGNIYVHLFNQTPTPDTIPIDTVELDEQGEYSFSVENGTYWVGAYLDVDSDKNYTNGEPIGFAVNKLIGEPITEILISGSAYHNADITLQPSIIEGLSEGENIVEYYDTTVTITVDEPTDISFIEYTELPYPNPPDDALNKWIDISVENFEYVDKPINIKIYYTQQDLTDAGLDSDEALKGIYFYNESSFNWELYNETGVNRTETWGYKGYCWANVYHLTPLAIGGNRAPTAKITSPASGFTVDGTIDVEGTVSDPDGNYQIDKVEIWIDPGGDPHVATLNTDDWTWSWSWNTNTVADFSHTIFAEAYDIFGDSQTTIISVNVDNIDETTDDDDDTTTDDDDDEEFVPPGEPTDNTAPTADAGGPYFGIRNIFVEFDGSDSSDTEDDLLAFKWDFGDEKTSTQQNPEHKYIKAGNYTVKLTVTDSGGKSGTDTTYAVISDTPNIEPNQPTITGTSFGEILKDYNYTFRTIDPDEDNVRYYIDWKDGVESVSNNLTSGETFNATHNWTEPGLYIITARAEDTANKTSAIRTFKVLIGGCYAGDKGCFVDTNDDGIYDSYYSNETDESHTFDFEGEGIYSFDFDGDGENDFQFDSVNNVITSLSSDADEEKEKDDEGSATVPLIIAIVIIGIVLLLIYFWKFAPYNPFKSLYPKDSKKPKKPKK